MRFRFSHLAFVVLIVFFVLFILWFGELGFATVGVGIGPGKIFLKDNLISGLSYKAPGVTVINTGTETKTYGVRLSYPAMQTEQKPASDWFEFKPQKITLAPGESQVVGITLNIPRLAKPGKYHAYIEAYPIVKSRGSAMVGLAAAAKVYFTVKSGSLVFVLYHRARDFFGGTAPSSYIVAGLVGIALLVGIFRKFFSFSISLKKEG